MSARPIETKAGPVCILVRVSTVRQETARQVNELRAVAESKGWEVTEVCKETITGRASADERKEWQRVEALAAAGKIKKVLVHEISRLSRRPSLAHTFVESLEEYGVSLYWLARTEHRLLPVATSQGFEP